MEKASDNWMALESNPDVMNPFLKKLGFDTSLYVFQDLLSTDDWAQEMIAKPTKAVMFLYPIKETTEKFRNEEEDNILKAGQTVSPHIYYMKQLASNACGTVAVFHVVMNLLGDNNSKPIISKNSILDEFEQETRSMSPLQRGEYFMNYNKLKEVHSESVLQGQSEVVESVETHFICFIQKEGHIYELDGRKMRPINHGKTNDDTFLGDVCKVIRQFMDRDPDEVQFTLMAFAPPPLAE